MRKRATVGKARDRARIASRRLTVDDVEVALDQLEECGLIRRETMPDGEVRIYLPHAPAPACHNYLILEG